MDIDAMQRQLRQLMEFRDHVHILTGGPERFAEEVKRARDGIEARQKAQGASEAGPVPETGDGPK